jgi:hypothetical protein
MTGVYFFLLLSPLPLSPPPAAPSPYQESYACCAMLQGLLALHRRKHMLQNPNQRVTAAGYGTDYSSDEPWASASTESYSV